MNEQQIRRLIRDRDTQMRLQRQLNERLRGSCGVRVEFRHFVHRYLDDAFTLAFHLSGKTDAASKVTYAAFMMAYRLRDSIESEGLLKKWVFKTIRQKAPRYRQSWFFRLTAPFRKIRKTDVRQTQPLDADCQKYQESFVDSINQELPPEQNAMLDAHLSECPRCRQEYERMTHALRQLRTVLQPINAPDTLHQRILASLDQLETRQEFSCHGLFGGLAVAAMALIFVGYAGVAYYETRQHFNERASLVRGVADSQQDVHASQELAPSVADLLQSGQDVVFLAGPYAAEGVSLERVHAMLSGEFELSHQTRFISVQEPSDILIRNVRDYFEAHAGITLKEYTTSNGILVIQAASGTPDSSEAQISFNVILLGHEER